MSKHGDFFLVAQDMVLSHRAKFQLIMNLFRVKAISTGLVLQRIKFSLSCLVAIFSQPNLNEDQKKQQGLEPSLCDFYPLNLNEDQSKQVLLDDFFCLWFYCAIFVLLCAIYVFFFARYSNEDQTNLKKRYFPLTLYGGRR